MFVFLSLILVGIANGVVIPSTVWWLFGIHCFAAVIKTIGDRKNS